MTDDQREAYEERAAILEFEAGMSRSDAERMAAIQVEFEIIKFCKRRRLETQERLGIPDNEKS
jgi:hypothetical protein